MPKMGKKKKSKHVNIKKEKYAKFRKEKSSSLTFAVPELSEEEMMQKKEDEKRINSYLRYRPRYPERFIIERKARSKR